MPHLKLIYFDFHGGRGEVARLAMIMGDIPFEDCRIPVSDWPKHRDAMPFHALPVLEVDGVLVAQSNAINRYLGGLAGLYPQNPVQALYCDEVMDAVEDVVSEVVATFGTKDPDALKAAREALVAGPIRFYLERLAEILQDRGGRYFADDRLTVADLKVAIWIKSLRAGVLDHVPQDLVDRLAPGLVEHFQRVYSEPSIEAYYQSV